MISIIIPLYNKEHYILDTINSVFCQTNKDWECVIVDDRSTDRGPELVKNIHDSRIKYLKKKMEEFLLLEILEFQKLWVNGFYI